VKDHFRRNCQTAVQIYKTFPNDSKTITDNIKANNAG